MSETQGTSAEADHREGLALLDRGKGAQAFEHLSRAYHAQPESPRYRSAYAVALALVKREFLGAAELARGALHDEFYNPDLYVNLARIYLAHEFKAEAVRVLRRGLMVDPDNAVLIHQLAALGLRRRPPIPFLPRAHALNRLVGRLVSRLAGPIPTAPQSAGGA